MEDSDSEDEEEKKNEKELFSTDLNDTSLVSDSGLTKNGRLKESVYCSPSIEILTPPPSILI